MASDPPAFLNPRRHYGPYSITQGWLEFNIALTGELSLFLGQQMASTMPLKTSPYSSYLWENKKEAIIKSCFDWLLMTAWELHEKCVLQVSIDEEMLDILQKNRLDLSNPTSRLPEIQMIERFLSPWSLNGMFNLFTFTSGARRQQVPLTLDPDSWARHWLSLSIQGSFLQQNTILHF